MQLDQDFCTAISQFHSVTEYYSKIASLSNDRQVCAEPPPPSQNLPCLYREALFHQVDIKGVRVVEVEEAFLRQQLLLVRQVTVEGILDQDVIISIIYYYYIGKIHICDTYVNDRYL